MLLNEYVGNLHTHSRYSDGSGSIPDIASAAADAGLDFVCITDHNNMRCLDKGEYGYISGVLVIPGEEINTSKNHYLAYGIDKAVEPDDDNPQKVIDEVNRRGGFGFLAHPFERGSKYIMDGKTYPWTAWDVEGYQGICIWNMLSQWRDSFQSISSLIRFGLINPGAAFTGPSPEVLALWDGISESKPVFGITGSDAHALKFKIGPFKYIFGSYRYSFKCINTHVLCKAVLSGSYPEDAAVLLDAIKKGRTFAALDLIGNSAGFRTEMQVDSRVYEIGDEIKCTGKECLQLRIKCPDGVSPKTAHIRIVCGGLLIYDSPAADEITTIKPDRKYIFGQPNTTRTIRLEVYRKRRIRGWRPWIYTNPYRLRYINGD